MPLRVLIYSYTQTCTQTERRNTHTHTHRFNKYGCIAYTRVYRRIYIWNNIQYFSHTTIIGTTVTSTRTHRFLRRPRSKGASAKHCTINWIVTQAESGTFTQKLSYNVFVFLFYWQLCVSVCVHQSFLLLSFSSCSLPAAYLYSNSNDSLIFSPLSLPHSLWCGCPLSFSLLTFFGSRVSCAIW